MTSQACSSTKLLKYAERKITGHPKVYHSYYASDLGSVAVKARHSAHGYLSFKS